MTTDTKRKSFHSAFPVLAIILCSILVVTGSLLAFFFYCFSNRIFPNVYVAGVYVGGKTKEEARQILSSSLQLPEKITLQGKEKTFELSLSEIQLKYNIDASIDHAYERYRYDTELQNLHDQITSFFVKSDR